MRSLELSDYIAAVSDFDDTILDNKTNAAGTGLHARSRIDALRVVGVNSNLDVLLGRGVELNPTAFLNASEHTVDGAFWWLLEQCGLVAKGAPVDASHPLIKQLVDAKHVSYREMLKTEASEVPGASRFFGLLHQNGFAGHLAIASTGFRQDILAFFGTHGFDRYFPPEHVVAKEDTTKPKPNPEVFIKALALIGVPVTDAPRTLGFEDDPRGISGLRQLGIFTCALTTRFTEAELMDQPTPPNFVAADFNEYIDAFGL